MPMTFKTLIRRSLRFHARAHAGVVLGAAIGSAALIGALLVGDSVRETLRERALERLGGIHFAVSTGDRLFDSAWAGRALSRFDRPGWLSSPRVSGSSRFVLPIPVAVRPMAPVGNPQHSPIDELYDGSALSLSGVAARQDGAARVNRVNVIGGGPALPFGAYLSARAKVKSAFAATGWSGALINETLARHLDVRPGNEIILRVRKPSALALDAALSPRDDNSVALRLKVGAILPADQLGDFALAAPPAPPANLFLFKEFLADKLGVRGHANLLAFGPVLVPEAREHGWLWRQQLNLSFWLMMRAHRNRASLTARLGRFLLPESKARAVPDELALPCLEAGLASLWLPEDAGVVVRAIEQPQTETGGEYIRPWIEIASSRVFLDPPVVAAALTPRSRVLTNTLPGVFMLFPFPDFSSDSTNDVAFARSFIPNGFGVLTYLANAIRAGERLTPYSMVTAAGGPFLPAGMRDDEILVNQWLADDLQARPGDTVALSYYVADSGSRLTERTNSFRVRAIVPIKGLYADRTLMPEFPGLAKAESTHDWNTGFPLVYKLRDKDEAYWKQYRGTPKAFVTLAAGQAMWANRFGSLTAIRYQVPTNSFASSCRQAVYRNLVANLKPADLGFRLEPVREQALKAAAQSQDFGQLFLGFSFFLVVSALLLMALLFQFGLEQRMAEVGTLLALGFSAKQVRRLLLAEGAALALLGGVIGVLGGLAYARAMLWGLATVWRNAVGTTSLQFHASPLSLAIGLFSSTVVATLTIWLTLRRQARRPVKELLESTVHSPQSIVHSPQSARRDLSFVIRHSSFVIRHSALLTGLSLLFAALAVVVWALASGERSNAGAFFGAGTLLLISGLVFLGAWLGALARAGNAARLTVSGLGVRSCARRRGRSLATTALLACGCFVIAAIGVFRLDASRDAAQRTSGTGGFALLGQSTLPIVQDLNTTAGREALGLGAQDLQGVKVVPFRLREGDDASCLNLNRAQRPRLLGVKPELLAGRFTFTGAAKGYPRRLGWRLIQSTVHSPQSTVHSPQSTLDTRHSTLAADEVRAIGDANSIEWALGKKLGDTLDYTDEQGRPFKVQLVGAVANSILQGSLVIDEADFVRRFPNESGYRMFLIDAPSNSVRQVSATLSRALEDAGLELTPAAGRLEAFNAVQNTYLGTFQVLGGLGLLLGSAGLGVVVLRNVLERRGELGLLVAVGFRRRTLQAMMLSEHGALLALGLGLGILAAAVAVLPSVLTPGARLPYRSLALTLGAVFLNGALWTWLATRYALRGNLLEALRNE